MSETTLTTLTTLVGYLGKDREIRQTRERTNVYQRYDEIAEEMVDYEVTIRPRDYARLSLATRERRDGRWVTTWHQLIAFGVDQVSRFNIRLARKGDRVEVTGHPETFRFTGGDGQEVEITRLVVDSFRLLRPKPRQQWP